MMKDISPMAFTVISLSFVLPFSIGFLIFFGVPAFTPEFWKFLITVSILDTIAAVIYYKALSMSEISLLAPISSFNPAFVLIFATIFLHENPTPVKLIGILLIIIGAYLLNVDQIRAGIFKPVSKLLSDRGVKLFLVSNLIWGMTPILQKKAIFQTSPTTPVVVPLIETVFIIIFLLPFLFKMKNVKKYVKVNLKTLLAYGSLASVGQFAALTAFSLNNVAYVTAVFKLSALISIVMGAILFKEHHIQERFLGALVMVIGTILIAL